VDHDAAFCVHQFADKEQPMAKMFRTTNPALNLKAFEGVRPFGSRVMTVEGTVNRAGILLLCAVATAAWTWGTFQRTHNPADVSVPMTIGVIGGFVVALVTIFKKEWSPVTAPVYALLEGLALGGISAMMNLAYPGIAIQAVGLTFGTLAVMLMAYRSGLIRATARFKMAVVSATGAIMLVYVVSMVLSFFGIRTPYLDDASPIGILISLVIVGVAALNLILDFDMIETGASQGAPQYMEWYASFGLMVTLVWLYLEMLRLLSKLRER
jgi:uncharacterized YccA/Bax inhibitor family protein